MYKSWAVNAGSSHDEWDKSNLFQKFSFSVPNRMLALGKTKDITFDDLTAQPKSDYLDPMLRTLKSKWLASKDFWFVPRLMVALIKCRPITFLGILIGTIIEGTVKVFNPVLLLMFLKSIQDPNADPADKYYYASGITALAILYTLTHHALFFYTMRAGWNWRSSTQALVFDHLLSLDSSGLEKSTKGNLVNLVSNDVGKFEAFTIFMCFFIVSPFELGAVLYLLSRQLDFLSALSGLSLCLLFLPLQVKMGSLFAALRTKTAANTDARIRHISESIEGVATVKSYGWETPFFALIKRLRLAEQSTISSSQRLKAITKGLDYCIVPSCNLVMQYVFWLRGGILTLPLVFSCLLFLQVMRSSIFGHWAMGVELGSEAIASCRRLEGFLNRKTPQMMEQDILEAKSVNASAGVGGDIELTTPSSAEKDLDPAFKKSSEALNGSSDVVVSEQSALLGNESAANASSVASHVDSPDMLFCMHHAKFCYGTNTTKFALANITLEMKKNELLIVVGPVGAGKTSFLAALLGEMNMVGGDGTIRQADNFFCGLKERPRVAYAQQIPWIFSASVKQNVTFSGVDNTGRVDERMYELSMQCCCINEDLKQLPNGHDTEIGEKGVSISGGQKARLGLARAVYSDADIYLLDDPLSAVDAHVSRVLFEDCILGALKKRGKSIVLCTHQLQYLKYADKVLVLNDDGTQQFYGTFEALENSKSQVHSLQKVEEEANRKRVSSVDSRERARSRGRSVSELATEAEEANEGNDSSNVDQDQVGKSDEQSAVEHIQMVEDELKGKTGDISRSVYVQWLRAGGLLRGVFSFALIVLGQIMLMIHEYWLRWWVQDRFQLTDSQYLWIMAVMTPCVFLTGFMRVKLFFDFTITSASTLHQRSIWAVLHSPLSFFTANPSGRILNRFAKDQSEMDERLPYVSFDCVSTICMCIGASILICISMPALLAAFPPLILIFTLLRRKYMDSVSDIKRIESATRSPIYAGFSASLEGLVTLRAYKLQDKMRSVLIGYLDENGRAWWSFLMCARWFGFRMDLLAILVLTLTVYFAAFYSDRTDKGLLGFAVCYSMSLCGAFQWAVRLSTEVETMMTAVERVTEYAQLPPEDGYAETLERVLKMIDAGQTLTSPNPTALNKEDAIKGGLHMKNLIVRYRSDLKPVLNGLNMTAPAGSKCGIVGRTGCGKSTILSALLRLNLVDPSGSILLDGNKDLLKASLEETRGLITVIPQQPHLFLGTLRFNLDPFDVHTDDEIWQALQEASVVEFVKSSEKGLMMRIEEAGSNISVGQKQLLSLARAILRRTRIFLMDEVTASVDYETDATIQRTIRTAPSLCDATIITVAHRLQTIADSDRIFVISAGKLLEEGTPLGLLQKEGSHFAALVQRSGEKAAITKIASDRDKQAQVVGQ